MTISQDHVKEKQVTQLVELPAEADILGQRAADQRRHKLLKEVKELTRQLSGTYEPRVSDHAIVRYLECKRSIDIDAIGAEILSGERAGLLKAGTMRIKMNGLEFVCKKGVVATILG